MYYYSLVDFLAFLLLVITNHDILLKKPSAMESPQEKHYRLFLYAVSLYYLADIVWAWLYAYALLDWLYVETELYLAIMPIGICLWIQYVVEYLGVHNAFRQLLNYAGRILLVYVLLIILLNRMSPIMFWFDEAGVFQSGIAREVMYVYQVLILLMTSIYTISVSMHSAEAKKKRHMTICLSGMIMLVFIAFQIFFPLYPLYAISYMLGCCLLRTFVIENEREEYRQSLEISLAREKEHFQELKNAWKLAYTDVMTGVKSKLAYAEKGELIDKQIAKGDIKAFAIAVFDVNDLKLVNDTMGHDVGDEFIQNACHLICGIFKKSPVYRVGGDEFVAILEQEDYENRASLLQKFNQQVDENRRCKSVVIAVGMAEYIPEEDNSYKRIFERADLQMYQRKRELKAPVVQVQQVMKKI